MNTFCVPAIVQSLGAMIQAGALSWLFSDIAMSGYMTGAAIEIFTSQLKGMFGLELPKESEPLKVFYVRCYIPISEILKQKINSQLPGSINSCSVDSVRKFA